MLTQPIVAVGMAGLAALALSLSVLGALPVSQFRPNSLTLVLPICLAALIALAYKFPIYIRHNTKICVGTVPLYLMAALASPTLATLGAGTGVLAGELLVRTQRGSHLSDIATHVARWTVIVLLGALVAHQHASGALARSEWLAATILILWAGDIVTLPLALSPITGESPEHIIATSLRQGGLVEAAQYGVGMVGALVALLQPWALALIVVPTALVYLVFKKEVDPDTARLLEGMADAVDLRDPHTIRHSAMVAEIARSILTEWGMHGQEAALIVTAARLHDIGKVEVPDYILLKRDELAPEERTLIEAHAKWGAELLQRYSDFARIEEMVRHHHERWDGRGYPAGLKATEIPFGARLIAVAESFDSMTSRRPYRQALSADQAATILLQGRGRQWDPSIVDAFLRSIGDERGHSDERSPMPSAEAAEAAGATVTA